MLSRLNQRNKRHRAGRRNNRRASFATAFDRGEDHRLVSAATTARAVAVFLPVACLAADVGFVGLDDPRERQCLTVSEHRADAVQQVPACAVLHAKMMMQAHCTDRLGGVEDQEHCDVPEPQRQMRAFHCRADSDGELALAAVAAIETRPRRDSSRLVDRAAFRADRAIRPAHAFHVRAARGVSVEFSQECRQLHSRNIGLFVNESNRYQRK
jgi:hypothetical protein